MERLQAIAAQKAELAEHQAMADKLYNDHKLFMSSRQDEDIIGEDGAFKTTLYRDTWNKTYEEIKKLSGSFVYRDSKAAFDNWVTKSQPTWQVGTDVAVIKSKNQKLIMQADAFLDQLAFLSPATVRTILGVESAQYFTDDPRIDEIMKAEQGPKDLTDDLENRTKLAEKTVEELVAAGAITPQYGLYMTDRAAKTIRAAHDKRVSEALLAGATSFVDPETKAVDVDAGFKYIEKSNATTEQKRLAREEFTQWHRQDKVAAQQDWDKTKEDTEIAWQKLLDEGDYKGIIDAAKGFDPDIPGHGSDAVDMKQEWTEGAKKALKAEAAGEDIVLDPAVKSALLDRIPLIMIGADSMDAVLADARKARHFDRTLPQTDLEEVERLARQEYASVYGHTIGAIKEQMRGRLLKPDSFGFQASPVRHEIYSRAWSDFLGKVAAEGDKLTPDKMYAISRGVIAAHEVSEARIGEIEDAKQLELEAKEAGVEESVAAVQRGFDKAIRNEKLRKALADPEQKPQSLNDFYEIVRAMNATDPKKAREYYDKYKGEFE
jgi:hypothetical protein